MSLEADLRAFHEAIGQEPATEPAWPEDRVLEMRVRLIREEAKEAIDALSHREPIENVAKELCDLVFVAVHAAVSMGIPFDECWRRVQISNLAKAGGPVREDGKVLKPPGWTPPDLRSVIFPEG